MHSVVSCVIVIFKFVLCWLFDFHITKQFFDVNFWEFVIIFKLTDFEGI